jgi:D-lactate dehydrogenase
MKLAFFDAKSYDVASFDKATAGRDITVKYFETHLNEDTVGLCRGFDAVCVFVNDSVTAKVIDALYGFGIRFLVLRCAGYNNVDVRHAFGKIHVAHVPAYSPYAVAEHTVALLLTSVRRIHKAYNRTREFNFSLSGLTGFDLHGKTVGIVGTGKIGRIFGDICRGFGMKILAYDKFPAEGAGLEYVSLDRLFAESDVISFHCPLTEETRHLVNERTIGQMKKGVVLLNTSRGAIIDAEALLGGIQARKIGAACLDVYEEESDFFFEDLSGLVLQDDILARLISMPNVIVTSHQAFLTEEALSNIAETTLCNLEEFFRDGSCKNEVKA